MNLITTWMYQYGLRVITFCLVSVFVVLCMNMFELHFYSVNFGNADVGCWWRVGRREQRVQVSAMRREVRSDRLKGINGWLMYLFCCPFAISSCTDSNREVEEQERHTSHHAVTCSAWTKNELFRNKSKLKRPRNGRQVDMNKHQTSIINFVKPHSNQTDLDKG